MDLSEGLVVEILKTMLRIRHFELAVSEHIQQGDIPGFAHSYVGEEAVAAGVCALLRIDDYVTSTHRGHGHCIAKGADIKRLMAELWSRDTGYCGGRGGSMHIYAKDIHLLGTNGIVGGGLTLALGPAMHAKLNKTDQVCVCFFGDGAANTGMFHEALNLAAVQDLPVIFVCENNLYATVTRVREATKIDDFADRAIGYGMPGKVVDGNDIIDVFENADAAVTRARNGEGPTLLECKTYRHFGHYIGEEASYRPEEEIKQWLERDPIEMFYKKLNDAGELNKKQLEELEKTVKGEIDEAVEFARNSPSPDPETVAEYVWAGR